MAHTGDFGTKMVDLNFTNKSMTMTESPQLGFFVLYGWIYKKIYNLIVIFVIFSNSFKITSKFF